MPADTSNRRLVRAPTGPVESLHDRPHTGFTVSDVARRYRVGEDKVRGWIVRGELKAVNTSFNLCGKPRWVIPPEALVEFERKRAGGPPPKLPHKRRRRPQGIDFYPD
jgi:hypothetical protein